MIRPISGLLYVCLVLLPIVIIEPHDAQAESWTEALAIAQDIFEKQAKLDEITLIDGLERFHYALDYNVGLRVPRKLAERNKNMLMGAICLVQLFKISPENCLMRGAENSLDFAARFNYFGIVWFLKSKYHDENMIRIIDKYFNIQFELCKTGLIGHFKRKLKELSSIQDQISEFIMILIEQFKDIQDIEEAPVQVKIEQNAELVKLYYSKASLIEARRARGGLIHVYRSTVRYRCNKFLNWPLRTLMMTYDRSGGDASNDLLNVQFRETFPDYLQAFKLCKDFKTSIDQKGEHTLANVLRNWLDTSESRYDKGNKTSSSQRSLKLKYPGVLQDHKPAPVKRQRIDDYSTPDQLMRPFVALKKPRSNRRPISDLKLIPIFNEHQRMLHMASTQPTLIMQSLPVARMIPHEPIVTDRASSVSGSNMKTFSGEIREPFATYSETATEPSSSIQPINPIKPIPEAEEHNSPQKEIVKFDFDLNELPPMEDSDDERENL